MASIVETMDLDAPVERTYAVWADVRRWPEFLHHVDRVDVVDEKTFRWWLDLPGAEEAFEAELTEVIPQKRIAWRTTQGADHAGVVTFHHVTDTTSRIALQIEYEPTGFIERLGALTNLDSVLANYDLGQLKAMVEEGRQP
jgi:uncharacterized membrane protein